MGEWKEYKLGEVAEVKGGKRLPKGELLVDYETPHPYIRVTDLGKKWVRKNGLQFVTTNVQKLISRYTVNSGDVVLSIVGSIGLVGRVSMELDRANLTENCVKLLTNKKIIDDDFLFYFLLSEVGQEEIEKRNVGSTQPKLPLYNIKDIVVPLPQLSEQKSIASILSSLDDKIDLLHRQNATLEAMAETLFRQWFVEEAKEEWEEGNLGMLSNIDTGFAFKSEFYKENGTLRVVRGKNVTIGSLRWSADAKYWDESTEGFEKYFLKKWDIVIGMDGSRIGQNRSLVLESDLPAILAQRVARLRAKNLNQQPFIWRHVFSDDFQDYIIAIHTGTSIPHISQNQITDYQILIPPKALIDLYSENVRSFWDKYEKNTTQIRTLTALRDILLPKLMSGEVRVENE